jgi:hypothetical protein
LDTIKKYEATMISIVLYFNNSVFNKPFIQY